MPTTLYLIRHGITEWNQKGIYCGRIDVPLSKEGKLQATRLSRKLRSVRFDKIYSSSKKRALQTARIVFGDSKIIRLAQLREVNFGVMEGLTYEQILKKYPAAYRKWFKSPYSNPMPKAENLNAFKNRIEKAINGIVKSNKDKTIAIVCHGGSISIFLTRILRNKKFWEYIPSPATATIVDVVHKPTSGKKLQINYKLRKQKHLFVNIYNKKS
ncbi:MAG: histidine phosphatase family protein [Candidatus Omnitrophica bacterium]|jgi:broad specificity phosphatase PhoE|nr:histidine phosphatase family protein [Candidatus Omnitrophota bacterium]MDD5079245.1 histidine phosphatase family protein [Candidatus Omnitrophota bacterium]